MASSIPVDIGIKRFASRKNAAFFFKTIIRKYPNKEKISPEDADYISALLNFHPSKEEKIGCGVDYFYADSDSTPYGTRCFYIVRKDGTCTDFSYIKCLQNTRKTIKTKTAAFDNLADAIKLLIDNGYEVRKYGI